MFDLLIRNGKLYDPASGRCGETADLAVLNGRIAGIGDYEGESAVQVIDASDCLVTPGLIDHHMHIYPMAKIGAPAEAVCFAGGVTSAVDAGSTGCRTFPDYLDLLSRRKLRIRAFLNVCSTGLLSLPRQTEDILPEHFEEEAIRDLFAKHPDKLTGLKLRTSRPIVGAEGYRPLEKTVELAERIGVPVMVHCTDPPGTIPELLSFLRPGDILTHMYMNKGPNLLNKEGEVYESAREARKRGVLFEAADAREHFSFAVSRPAIAQGFYPDLIATDLTRFSMNLRPTAFSLTNQIAKYTQLGIPFMEVLAACTIRPARQLGIEGECGTLCHGSCADIALFKKEESRIPFGDRPYGNPDGQEYPCTWRLRTMLTVRGGEMVYRDPLF